MTITDEDDDDPFVNVVVAIQEAYASSVLPTVFYLLTLLQQNTP